MKEFLVFYYIVLAIALSITIPICYYCNQIDKRQENKYEKLKNDTVYQKKLKREKELRAWVMDETWY